MNKIPSFEKDHINMKTGFSVSTAYGDITVFDLRFVKPNSGRYISPAAMHTIEHIMAVLLRSGEYKDDIVYFGPMGCRTGFYLLSRNLSAEKVKELVRTCAEKALELTEIAGATEKECGNYKEHNLSAAKKHLKSYLKLLH